jgi:hypothetical protein
LNSRLFPARDLAPVLYADADAHDMVGKGRGIPLTDYITEEFIPCVGSSSTENFI